MKSPLLVTLSLLLAAGSAALADVRINAQSIASSRKAVLTETAAGEVKNEVVRTIGIEVALSSFKAVKEPCEVEVFFIAKTNSDKSRWVYDVQKATMTPGPEKVKFFAVPLRGESNDLTLYNVEVVTAKGTGVIGTVTRRGLPTGSKIEGWIVRAKSGGKVLSVEASLPELRELAKKNPAAFDSAAADERKPV